MGILLAPFVACAASKKNTDCLAPLSLSANTIASQLGWVSTHDNRCGGYYLESPFLNKDTPTTKNLIEIKSAHGMTFSQHGTSFSEGKITIFQNGQQIIANQAYLYRDPTTQKINAIDLIGHVILRSPNELVIAKRGHYAIDTHAKTLADILYRTAIYSNTTPIPAKPSKTELENPREVTQLSAHGEAASFSQAEPKINTFEDATYSTCPPTTSTWKVKAKHIELNKITGRGYATHARVLVHGVPVFYSPYLNFPIDNRRQSGFLWPTIGSSSELGISFSTPFYWNLAPNYDTTITPAYLGKRGFLFTDLYRYLTKTSEGRAKIEVLPNDRKFSTFQATEQSLAQTFTTTYDQANLRRLENASPTRKAFSWQNDTQFNEHWSANVDYSYVSDDYYLKDLSSGISTITQNQLLQQAQLNYHGQYWNFLGRMQSYQTLYPLGATLPVQSQYSRFPQLVFNGDYPSPKTGLDFFISNDLTRFDIRDTPGSPNKFPMGDRFHIQPGVSFPFFRPDFYFEPRLQLALTKYEIGRLDDPNAAHPERALPIFDIASGLYFDRDLSLFHQMYRQTLEPQIYYTYVPYRDQNNLPLFDTTVNTLNFDQLFLSNRFSGLDRIADANQITFGLTSRLRDLETGTEKIRASIGQILYFQNRRVALCNNPAICSDTPYSPLNRYNRSPIAGLLSYTLTPHWNLSANTIWNPQTSSVNNQAVSLQFQQDAKRIITLNYTYTRNGIAYPTDPPGSSLHPLSQTSLSAIWPISRDWNGYANWMQNWNHNGFQNLLYGLQYDSCCWAVRFVTGRTFIGLKPDNTLQYNTQFFIQFALKGLGNVGNNDPSALLNSSITGYQSNFGQDF